MSHVAILNYDAPTLTGSDGLPCGRSCFCYQELESTCRVATDRSCMVGKRARGGQGETKESGLHADSALSQRQIPAIFDLAPR